jgi:hypothetical protein
MSLKEYSFKILGIVILNILCFSLIRTIFQCIVIWNDFLSNLIYGFFLSAEVFFNFKKLLLIIMFLIPYTLLTFYIKRIRNVYFILFYLIFSYFIIFGKGIYYFLLNQNNTTHSSEIIISLTTIFISSFIFNHLLKKYLWKEK